MNGIDRQSDTETCFAAMPIAFWAKSMRQVFSTGVATESIGSKWYARMLGKATGKSAIATAVILSTVPKKTYLK